MLGGKIYERKDPLPLLESMGAKSFQNNSPPPPCFERISPPWTPKGGVGLFSYELFGCHFTFNVLTCPYEIFACTYGLQSDSEKIIRVQPGLGKQ